MITACGANVSGASAASSTLLPSPAREDRGGGLQCADSAVCSAASLPPGVVDIATAIFVTPTVVVLHQLTAPHGRARRNRCPRACRAPVSHHITSHRGAPASAATARGRGGSRADAARKPEYALGAEQLLVVGDRALGLALVVERDDAHRPVHAALGARFGEDQLGASQHDLDLSPSGPLRIPVWPTPPRRRRRQVRRHATGRGRRRRRRGGGELSSLHRGVGRSAEARSLRNRCRTRVNPRHTHRSVPDCARPPASARLDLHAVGGCACQSRKRSVVPSHS